MIVALGGRPLTGKSTLARALAEVVPRGVLLGTADLRRVLFPTLGDMPAELADWLYEGVLKAASWTLDTAPRTVIVLDGRPLTRSRDVQSLHRFASSLGHTLCIVECVCPDDVALARAAGVARVQGSLTYSQGTDPIPEPTVVVDTCRPLEQCVAAVVDAVPRLLEGEAESAPACSVRPL
ncbi:ATP-binding protein (plasmid) [Streptomyces nojiriensis]|uniref:AAA family ATPase n=1 Tax=Streptomyces nojiriensis TaxID=66374 RepID=UPI002E193417